MYHFRAVVALFDFAQRAHALPFGKLLLLAGVKMDEAQVEQPACAVSDAGNKLFARLELDFLQHHFAFHLAHLANGRGGNRRDLGFVFVAQRQV